MSDWRDWGDRQEQDDEWGGGRRAVPVAVGPRPRETRRERARRRAAARRRRNVGLLGLALVVIMTVAAVVGGAKLWDSLFGADAPVTDYSGSGVKDFVFEVHRGDTTKVIGQRLKDEGVVATPGAFTDAAQGNQAIAAIQPGFYKLRTKIPGKDAVARLAEQENRVGLLVIPEGRQLDDVSAVVNGAVTEGIFTLIARASCVDLDGDKHCVAASDLRQAATTASQAELAVSDWASNGVNAVRDDHRRIEGLIAAGRWDFDPMAEPEQILASLIRESSAQYQQLGLLNADAARLAPYEVLVVASLLQREAKPRDFAKVARVVYNRLAKHQKLEFDSTVNYPLDRQEVATTDDDRERKTLWNTYVSQGLPATPISSPSPEALQAAEHPEPGDWLYFVTIDAEGTTLFTADYNEHLANIEMAKKDGILDSAR
ncbi:UPF0755 protein [Mycobacteroides chelonae]|nr:UPF0755 protein [Mycobacteroides chelonae]